MDAPRHPACDIPEQDRIDYLMAVASIAWADGVTDRVELMKLSEMCAALGVTGEGAGRVAAAASVPDRAMVERILRRFRKDPLRVALLSDVVLITFADGRVATGEAEHVGQVARELDLDIAQAILIGRYVEAAIQGRADDALSRELAQKLASLPVPHHSVVRDLFDRLRKRTG